MPDNEKDLQQQEPLPETQDQPQEDEELAETQAQPQEEQQIAGELEQAKQEAAGLQERLLRTLAEYDNYRKRTQKEKDAIYPQAQADTVLKFLPIIDNFERALQCECADPEFKKGVEMIFTSFLTTLKELSVEEIGQEGESFNPDFHNAVMHIEDEALGENVVAQVLQKGYRIGERVVRYAMVTVAN